LDILLEHKSHLSIDLQDKRGWTALHYAAFYKRKGVCKKLLEHGASPLIANDEGQLPNQLTNKKRVKQMLLEKEIEISRKSMPPTPPTPNEDEVIVPIDKITVQNGDVVQHTGGKIREPLYSIAWSFLWSALVSFWWNYRLFLYIGVLAATGAWTLLDYVPTILSPPPPVVPYPKVTVQTTHCNPPTSSCGRYDDTPNPNQPTTNHDPLEVRSFKLSPIANLESYLLNFGQFALFIISVLLIVYHFKKPLGAVRFWILVGLLFVAFIVGCLFIFDILF
jgi:hypothetical protein